MQKQVHVSTNPEGAATEQYVNDVLSQIAEYSRDYHIKAPDVPLRHCIEIGAGRVFRGSSSEETRVVQLAIAEMAARWLFAQSTAQPAE